MCGPREFCELTVSRVAGLAAARARHLGGSRAADATDLGSEAAGVIVSPRCAHFPRTPSERARLQSRPGAPGPAIGLGMHHPQKPEERSRLRGAHLNVLELRGRLCVREVGSRGDRAAKVGLVPRRDPSGALVAAGVWPFSDLSASLPSRTGIGTGGLAAGDHGAAAGFPAARQPAVGLGAAWASAASTPVKACPLPIAASLRL